MAVGRRPHFLSTELHIFQTIPPEQGIQETKTQVAICLFNRAVKVTDFYQLCSIGHTDRP